MGMAEDIVRRSRENTRRDQRQREEERRYNDPTNRSNWYRMHLEDFRKNELLDMENKRKIALQEVQNKGQLDVTDRSEMGQTKRTGMTEKGSMDRTKLMELGLDKRRGMEEKGLMERLGITEKGLANRQKLENINNLSLQRKRGEQASGVAEIQNKPALAQLDFTKSQEPFNQYIKLQELGTKRAQLGLGIGDTTGMDYRKYQKMLSDPKYAAREDSFQRKLASGQDLKTLDWSEDEIAHANTYYPGLLTPKQKPDKVIFDKSTGTYTDAQTRGIPFTQEQSAKPVYGPNYRGTVNPLGQITGTKPVSPTPLRDIFGETKPSVNPRYR